MDKNEGISAAKDAIGDGEKNDYSLSPVKHAAEFGQCASALAAILDSTAIRTTAEEYELADKTAGDAQKLFKKTFNRANVLVLITSIFIALIMVTGMLTTFIPPDWGKIVTVTFGILSFIAGAWATTDLFSINNGQYLEEWMKKRACAETHRLEYFDLIAKAPPGGPAAAVPIALLKLEYFRRYQLGVQLAFYQTRGGDHKADAARTLRLGSVAVGGAALTGGIAGILGGLDGRFAALAAFGAIFTSLSFFAATREATSQNRRNAERYDRTHETLNGLYKRLDEVREAVFDEGENPLLAFVEAVQEQISLEHRQWLGEKSEYQKAIATLDQTLTAHKAKIKV